MDGVWFEETPLKGDSTPGPSVSFEGPTCLDTKDSDCYIDIEKGGVENEEKEEDWENIPPVFEYGENVEFRKEGYWYLGVVEDEYEGRYTISFVNNSGGQGVLYDMSGKDMRYLTGFVGGLDCQVLWQGEWYQAKVIFGSDSNVPNVDYLDDRYYGFHEYRVDPHRIRFQD